MGQQYLIDSNVIIDYLSGNIATSKVLLLKNIVNATPQISVISQIEVLSNNGPKPYMDLVENFVADCIICQISPEIVSLTIALRKKHKLKTPDAIIAATALSLKFTLVTANPRDFANIKGLQVINQREG